MNIEIDAGSGFCFGVVYAIGMAEDELNKSDKLYCLGDIVHNNLEVDRLTSRGLITIDHEEFKKLRNCKVLIRAHGEPPETYKIAQQNNIQLVDATCPVVLKLQNRIAVGNKEIEKFEGQIVIYGKIGHAETLGLVGQTSDKAIVIEKMPDIEKIDFTKPISIFSQTTKSLQEFNLLVDEIRRRMIAAQGTEEVNLITNDTICRQVSHRDKQLRTFAKIHDIVIFVSGKKSSNGKVLYEICKKQNAQTYFVSNIDDLDCQWFAQDQSVGICGATSTPRWLMEKIASKIKSMVSE